MVKNIPPRRPACPVCDGERVAITLRTGKDAVEVHRQGWFSYLSDVQALACLGCGHIALQVGDLATLRAEVAENPQKFTW